MVSLEQRQSLATIVAEDGQLNKLGLLLQGLPVNGADTKGSDVREELLFAICSKDADRFMSAAGEVAKRSVSSESDWCQDDYLLFLLLLGNDIFSRPLTFLRDVIGARHRNANPVPRKINEVFSALERGEFRIEGEYCFLKIPFLQVTGKLHLEAADAQRALTEMSQAGLFDQMSPLIKILTQNAYDLVLTERQPLPTETALQLIEGFETHAKELSLGQWWRVITALPGRTFIAAIVIIIAIVPFLFGFGVEFERSIKPEPRTRPSTLPITTVGEVGPELPSEALALANSLPRTTLSPDRHRLLISISTEPFARPTPPFVVEASHPEKPIKAAFAFVQTAGGARTFTVVPIEHDGGRVRAVLPEEPSGARLWFVLEFEAASNEDAVSIGRGVGLRALQ